MSTARLIQKFASLPPGLTVADLAQQIPWVRKDNTPRQECFMSDDPGRTYSYGSAARDRTYTASPMHPVVRGIMERINVSLGAAFNVCVLNHYESEREHLGWHADDSPEQDQEHPICVVSFGAERELWVRLQGATGHTPPEDRFLMTEGSLFVMPAGYQNTHFHKIPKGDRPCGLRVSLTYRKLDH